MGAAADRAGRSSSGQLGLRSGRAPARLEPHPDRERHAEKCARARRELRNGNCGQDRSHCRRRLAGHPAHARSLVPGARAPGHDARAPGRRPARQQRGRGEERSAARPDDARRTPDQPRGSSARGRLRSASAVPGIFIAAHERADPGGPDRTATRGSPARDPPQGGEWSGLSGVAATLRADMTSLAAWRVLPTSANGPPAAAATCVVQARPSISRS